MSLADSMLRTGSRKESQSAVMVISDGKYSNEYATEQQVTRLKNNGVMIFMLPIADFMGDDIKTLKSWASEPVADNFELIPGLSALKFNAEIFTERVVAKFCPDSMSEKDMGLVDDLREYMMIR